MDDETYCPDEETYSPGEAINCPPQGTQQDAFTTGVGQDNIQQHGNHEDFQNYEQNNNNNIDIAENDISIEGELPEDTYVTIDDINIVREMNIAKLNIDPETGEEKDGEAISNTHQYNLRPRPITRNYKYIHPCPNQQSANYAQATRAHNDDAIKC